MNCEMSLIAQYRFAALVQRMYKQYSKGNVYSW